MTTIQAIETSYAGCRFRSRLEARWAVFLDRLGIRWEYEQQGFELPDGSRYLPDFHLPGPTVAEYIEVKGSDEMLARDMPRIRQFVQAANSSLIVLGQVPEVLPDGVPVHTNIVNVDRKLRNILALPAHGGDTMGWGFCSLWAELGPPTTTPQHLGGLCTHPQVADAYRAARSARFEHGESG